MKALTTLSAAILALTFTAAANAGGGNGADGWRKLQTPADYSQNSQTINQMKGINHNCPMMGGQQHQPS